MSLNSHVSELIARARACREEGLVDDALEIVSTARRMATQILDGHEKADALARIAGEYVRLSRIEEACPLLTEALLAAERFNAPTMPVQRYVMNSHTKAHGDLLTKIVSIYAAIGDVHKALAVAKMIDHPSALMHAMLSIQLRLAEGDRPHEAYEVFQSMPCSRNIALAAIAASAVRTGNRELALRIVGKEFEEFYLWSALAQVASAFEANGERDVAAELMQRALVEIRVEEDYVGWKAKSYAGLVPYLCRFGWTDEAEKLLAEADQLALKLEDPKSRMESFAAIRKARRRLNAQKPSAQVKKWKILVTDDEWAPRESMKIVLGGSGYEVLLFDSKVRAIEEIQRNKPDAAITDLCAPDLNGFDFIQIVRKLDPSIPVIVISGNLLPSGDPDGEKARKALRLGAFECMPKPFDVAHLREVVEQALKTRKSDSQT